MAHRRARPRGLGLAARRALWAYAFLAAPMAFYVGIRLVPAASALVISLHRWDILSSEKPFVGWANFRELWADPLFWRTARNTLRYAAAGIPAQIAGGLLIALLLQRVRRFRGLFRALYFVPFVTPIVAASWVWQWMYSPQFGPLNRILDALGLPAQAFLRAPGEALYAVAAMVVWEFLGFQVVIFLAGLEAIPRAYYEAAAVDGAGGPARFFHITVPLLRPVLAFVAVMLMNGAFGSFIPMYILTQGGPMHSTETLLTYAYTNAFSSFDFGYGAAVCYIFALAVAILGVAQIVLLRRQVQY